ncbi:MAG TPA: hypothetical protein VD886_19250 [Herpetosiphonaceae bacterium]|nr:hypothetical protein [Herpetosiphonaceae bacterium]
MRLIRHMLALIALTALSACGAASVTGPTAPPPPPTAVPTPPNLSGRIAYVTRAQTAIMTILPDGSDDRLLTTVLTTTGQIFTSLSASPDGQFLAYSRLGASGGSALTVLRRDGSKVRDYNGIGAPAWSPDGQHFVAPIIESEEPTNMYAVYPAGADQTVTPLARFDGTASAWFPDGKRLAYVNGKDIYAFDLAAKSSQLLANPPSGALVDWQVQSVYVQPDGARIWAYAGNFDSPGADGMRWWSLPPGGGELEEQIERRGDFIAAQAFAPDGHTLGYVEWTLANTCDAPRADKLYLSAVGAADQPAAEAAPLPGAGPYEIYGLTWEAGGGRLAFAAQPYDCNARRKLNFPNASIYVWPIDGSQPPSKIADGAYPAWIR